MKETDRFNEKDFTDQDVKMSEKEKEAYVRYMEQTAFILSKKASPQEFVEFNGQIETMSSKEVKMYAKKEAKALAVGGIIISAVFFVLFALGIFCVIALPESEGEIFMPIMIGIMMFFCISYTYRYCTLNKRALVIQYLLRHKYEKRKKQHKKEADVEDFSELELL